MDVKFFLESKDNIPKGMIELTGWLVDQEEGLFLLGDHFPEDYNYKYKIKISNSNIMYKVVEEIPSLAGGWSSIFNKAKIIGFFDGLDAIDVVEIFVQYDRGCSDLKFIDITDGSIEEKFKKFGNYDFRRKDIFIRDWMDY